VKDRLGFTLLEVMIAVTILATLTLFAGTTIRSWIKMKVKIQKDIDRWSEVYNAVRSIERDVSLAFNYRDINAEVEKKIKENQKKSGSDSRDDDTPPPQAFNPSAGDGEETKKLTQFIGTNKDLHFSALNHVRKIINAKESDQSETGYFLKKCKSRANPEITSNCLWRRSSIIIDDDVTEGGTAVPLLENVSNFELQYYGVEKDDWVNSWKSLGSGDALIEGKFPHAVKIKLETEREKKKLAVETVISLRFPNNPKKKKSEGQNSNGRNN
jgi:prepilin-type N-terminal cleavage/methylation domain-containing protein